MNQGLRKTLPHAVPALVLAVVASAAWAAWLGWDQQRDVHPDGSSTGPYEPWQVIGLVLTLLPPVCWAAYRRHLAGAVLGPTAGLTLAALYDWSDDGSGLFVIGAGLVMAGTFAATAAVTAVTTVITPAGRNGRPMPA
ncbi:hypothetical protein SUDANB58_03111 [Streptomyces sp. enrichment culture]|uniref:hypothetical protein n=1 Tax=Streptomyces sp. enrichment culture TaxID=1795815 RepID=UPI003F557B6C